VAFKLRTAGSVVSVVAVSVTVLATTAGPAASAPTTNPDAAAAAASVTDWRTLDGSGNNSNNPTWGQAGTQYSRVGPTVYADGVSQIVAGPPERYVSNRVFNDTGQNLFSEHDVSQWGWTWGQFIDHDIDLRSGVPAESKPIVFNTGDPLERFHNDFGPSLGFNRTPAAPGTGVTTPRQQINTITSYIDASNIYGSDATRLDWLRSGTVDGNPNNNSASLLLPNGFLPRKDARGNPNTAPEVELQGPLMGNPASARVAGDVRANENIALTATQTLFAREHNRIVAQLPFFISNQDKFQIARRIVGAEVQYITYHDFLPAMGVSLPTYLGYRSGVNASVSNEFATAGYRAHSQVHGEFEIDFAPGDYTAAQLAAFKAQGIEVTNGPTDHALGVPLNVAFGNPSLVESIGFAKVLGALSAERQYRNDEQIDETMRSVLFQAPRPGMPDPSVCSTPVINPACFVGVQDLGAIDIARGRDHGLPSYNALRAAYGLAPKASFAAITGEASENFPADPLINPADPNNDPNILDFTQLRDRNGVVIPVGSDEAVDNAVTGIRRSPLAARLKATYGQVAKVDAFTGMVSEPHVAGSELGELQLAIWKKQFTALRDGDLYYYALDPVLPLINAGFGIDYRHSLSEIISLNAGVTPQANVFKVVFAPLAPAKAQAAPASAGTSPAARTTPDAVEPRRSAMRPSLI
jgi:hypothetical protein